MQSMSPQKKNLHFSVDPQLAALLGENYRSTEEAIKELVDNAHDADADNVWVSLPDLFLESPMVIVRDNGSGMKTKEVEEEYLKIAKSRHSRKGNTTMQKKRIVKGRKGIGKFAGLLVAEVMIVETCAAGVKTVLTISKVQLSQAGYDLEKVDLPVETFPCDIDMHGTTVTLKGLNDNLNYPNSDRLKQLLARDYHRLQDLEIRVNEEKVGLADYSTDSITKEIELSEGIKATIIIAHATRPTKNSGVIYRVENKLIGRPENLLEDDEVMPNKLKKSFLCEVICDGLTNDITADGGAIIENSKLIEELRSKIKEELTITINDKHKSAMHMARLNYQRKIDRALEKLPEYKRKYAQKYLSKVLEKFYDEPEEKISAIISVMVDALENDHYWAVVKAIEDARDSDVVKLSEAFEDFGLMEMSMITSQTINRLKYLDELESLSKHTSTLEETMHKAIEKCPWIFGQTYSVMLSNKTLRGFVTDYLDKKYAGNRGSKRPDLFLASDVTGRHLLVEFKKPTITVGRDAEAQALKYADDFSSYIHNTPIDIILLGGRVDSQMSPHHNRSTIKFYSYVHLISEARTQLNWMLDELKKDSVVVTELV